MPENLVSIIIPVYNAEKYVDRCIGSVLAQDYSNIELVLVDDGSTDKSSVLCQAYADKYDWIKYYYQTNAGASKAREKGLELSAGEYLMFIDIDDYVASDYVSSMLNAMHELRTDIAVCPYMKTSEGENAAFVSSSSSILLTQDELFQRFFKYEFWGFWGGCYNRSLFDGLNFPVATLNEDYYIKAQIFAKTDRIALVENAKYAYETHNDSLAHSKFSLRSLDEFDNAHATWRFFSEACPKYSDQALSIAAEASVKLLRALNRCDRDVLSGKATEYKGKITSFLKSNLARILLDKHFLWKLKIVLLAELLKNRH